MQPFHGDESSHRAIVHHLIYYNLVLEFIGDVLRNYDTVVHGATDNHVADTAAPEHFIRIGKNAPYRNTARLAVDLAAECGNTPFLAVHRAVVKLKFYLGHLFNRFLRYSVFSKKLAKLVLRHGKVDIHLGIVRNGSQRLRQGCTHQRSGLIGQRAHYAV